MPGISTVGVLLLSLTAFGCRQEMAEAEISPVPQVGEYRFGVEGAPLQYQGDAAAIVMTGGQVPVHVFCGQGQPSDRVILACTSGDRKVVVMPNPCEFADTERYARLLCHEFGHVNGWTHGR